MNSFPGALIKLQFYSFFFVEYFSYHESGSNKLHRRRKAEQNKKFAMKEEEKVFF